MRATTGATENGAGALRAAFPGGDEMAARCRAFDWAATPLGPVRAWPQSLRTTAATVLATGFPCIVLWGPALVQLYNDGYVPFLGVKHPWGLGRPTRECWPEVWDFNGPIYARVLAGETVTLEDQLYPLRRRGPDAPPDDVYITISYAPVRDETGGVGGVSITLFDTTAQVAGRAAEAERARLLAELGAERERLHSLILQMPVPVALHAGPEHRHALVNDAYRRVSGGRDVTGLSLREAFPTMAGQGIWEIFDRVYATGEPWVGPETRVRYDRLGAGVEDDAWFDLRYEPVRDAEGRVTGILNVSSDVTDQVRARREVERLLAEAEAARREAAAANQAKSGFLATMSHELRTPINAVIGYAQLLDMGLAGPLTGQQRAYLERLTGSSRHLLGLVTDVLDLSKIEAGETRVAREDATTGPAVRDGLEAVAPAAAARGVRLVDACPDEAGVPFVGDEDRVRQVVLNLLSNAVKFTAPGGTITVTCDTVAAAPAAAAHLRGAGPWALVRVEDTGLGIAPEEQGRIFEPFHQVQDGRNSYTRTAGGTGLGLAISRRLARLMGGDLSVESAPGVGSAFTLWLPAARDDAGQPDETAGDRSARAERDFRRLETPGLGEVGGLLHAAVTEVIAAYTDRLRADPGVPRGATMTRIQLEDHAISFLADLAQSLVIVGDAGPEAAELLKDGSAIQRAIADAHGARRHAQGWDEAALRRDQQVFREEVERAVRERLKRRSDDVDEAVRVLLELIDRGQGIAQSAWRRAADAAR